MSELQEKNCIKCTTARARYPLNVSYWTRSMRGYPNYCELVIELKSTVLRKPWIISGEATNVRKGRINWKAFMPSPFLSLTHSISPSGSLFHYLSPHSLSLGNVRGLWDITVAQGNWPFSFSTFFPSLLFLYYIYIYIPLTLSFPAPLSSPSLSLSLFLFSLSLSLSSSPAFAFDCFSLADSLPLVVFLALFSLFFLPLSFPVSLYLPLCWISLCSQKQNSKCWTNANDRC